MRNHGTDTGCHIMTIRGLVSSVVPHKIPNLFPRALSHRCAIHGKRRDSCFLGNAGLTGTIQLVYLDFCT